MTAQKTPKTHPERAGCGTEVARLQMEVRTRTRLVRRIVDVATSTALPIVAKVLRTTRGWIDRKQNYRFTASEEAWTNTVKRRDGHRHPAKGRQLSDVLRAGTTFEFVHNTTDGTAVTVTAEKILKTEQPATAYPMLHDAAGTLAIEDLTDDDGSYFLFQQLGSPERWMQDHGMRLLADERLRTEQERLHIEQGLEIIRRRRRGPLLRHQPTATDQGSAPAAVETAERGSPASEETDDGVTLTLTNGDATPTVEIRNAIAYFKGPTGTGNERGQAEDESTFAVYENQKGRDQLARLARAVPGDMVVTGLYGESLNQRHRHRDAQTVLRHTVDVGRAALPESFDGPIDTDSDQGHALITAAGGLADLECLYGSRTNGIELYEQLTRWDPDPYGYARAKLGSEYVLAGRIDEAIKTLTTGRSYYPPNNYDLAICHIIRGDWKAAAVAIQQGLATNPYIAEMLTGNNAPMAAPNGNPGHWGRSRKTATAHVLRYGEPWNQVESAKAFLRWIATHPKTLKTLAEVRTPDHEAAFAQGGEHANELETDFIALVDGISDRWSELPTELLVQKVGIDRRPWTALGNRDD